MGGGRSELCPWCDRARCVTLEHVGNPAEHAASCAEHAENPAEHAVFREERAVSQPEHTVLRPEHVEIGRNTLKSRRARCVRGCHRAFLPEEQPWNRLNTARSDGFQRVTAEHRPCARL
jgi:hypothetical protein